MVKYPHNTSKGGTTMPQIPKEAQQAIEKQARSILNKYGEGSIYQKPGKKDQLQFLYDDETGTKRRKALSIPEGADPQQIKLEFIIKTLTNRYQLQQEQKKRQLLQETISQDFLEKVDKIVEALPETKKTLNPCTKTVNQVIDEFLVYYKSTNVEYVSYNSFYIHSKKMKEMLGTRKISTITKDDFQNFLNDMRNSKTGERLSKKYTTEMKLDFARVLKFAKDKNYITSANEIIENVKIPKNLPNQNPDDLFLDYDELAKVLFVVRNNNRYYTILTVLALTGLRSQELFALRKQDIDRKNHRLHIVQAIKMAERSKDYNNRGIKISTTKNESSTRYVPAVDSVLNLIDIWITNAKEKGIQAKADKKGNGDLVFTDTFGSVYDRNAFIAGLRDYIKGRKIKTPHITLHMCRHCFATYLHREHCDLHIIQQCMGHTTKRGSITEIHYIADDPNYTNIALPYLQAVEKKLIDACKKVQNEYSNTPNE